MDPDSWRWNVVRRYSRWAVSQRGGYALARWARQGIRPDRWRDRFITPDELQLKLDLATYPDCCMAVGLYELETLRCIRSLLDPGKHFVDCGANIGYFTMQAARVVGTGGRVDAFEPDAINRARLLEHLNLNGLNERVRIHDVAVSDQPGELEFFHPPENTGQLNHGQASVYASLVPGGTKQVVRTVRLDEELDHVPDLIKMDIEGAELLALRGAEKMLKLRRPPALIIEHNQTSAKAAGFRPGDLMRYLLEIQPAYRVYWIGWRLSRIATPEALDAIGREGNILVRME